MKRIFAALIFALLACSAASAQGCGSSNPNCVGIPDRPPGDSTSSAANTKFVTTAIATATTSISITCPAHQFVNVISGSGSTCVQPAFTDISGTISASQFPVSTWTNTRFSFNTNSTISSNTNCNGTQALNGATFFTLTINAANTFTAGCVLFVTNEDTGRGKLISPSGLSSFILWPLQTAIIYSQNNVWQVNRPQRWQSGNAQIQVDPVNGSDTNNDCLGTTTGSCQSIPGAASIAQKFFDPQGGGVGINLANGTYTTGLPFTFFGGNSGFFLYQLHGNTGQGANVIINGNISLKDYAAVQFSEITFSSSIAGAALTADQTGIADIASTVTFGSGGTAASFSAMSPINGGVINCSGGGFKINLTSMNIGVFVNSQGRFISGGGCVVTIPNAITIGTGFMFTDNIGFVDASNMTFTGAGVAGTTGSRFTVQRGSGIFINGTCPATFFPGSVAGTITAPGWCQ